MGSKVFRIASDMTDSKSTALEGVAVAVWIVVEPRRRNVGAHDVCVEAAVLIAPGQVGLTGATRVVDLFFETTPERASFSDVM